MPSLEADPSTETDRGGSAIPWRSPTLLVILASSLVGVMGVSMISPVLPELRSIFGVSDAQIGLVITTYTLPGIFLTPFVGLVADRIGRRRVLVPLLFMFGIAGGAIAFVDSFVQVIVLRFVQGIGASALVTLSVTLIGDLYENPRQSAIIGVNGSTIGIGAATYPLIGGSLAAIRWELPFLFFGCGILVGIVAAWALEEPTKQPTGDVRTYVRRLGAVAVLPEALAIFLALFVAFFVFYGAVLTALPLLLNDEFGLTSERIGPLLSVVAVSMSVVSSQYGHVSRWRSPPALVALGFVLFGASLLGIWLAPSPVFVAVALLGFGVGFGITMPSIDTTLVGLVSDSLRAGTMGVRTSMLRLGQTLGPVGFTFTAERAFVTPVIGYRSLLLGVGVVVILAGSIAYVLARRRSLRRDGAESG
ncbi:MAG: MFS transporter [Natronomonas sp.]